MWTRSTSMWTWRDLGRAIKAARWAFSHADDLTMLRHELWIDSKQTNENGDPTPRAGQAGWLCRRFLNSLPIR